MAVCYLGRTQSCFLFWSGEAKGEEFWAHTAKGFFGRNLTDMACYWSVRAFGYSLEIYQKYKSEELRSAQLEARLVETELKALREQLRPHFLLNTMNTIAVLVREQKNVTFMTLATDHEMRQKLEEEWARQPMSGVSLDILAGQSLTQLTRCSLAIVASGTATLECAMAGLPMLVIYKTSWLTYWLGRFLIQLPYLSMVNVLAGEKVVPEFLQGAMEPERLAKAALQILRNPKGAEAMAGRIRDVAKKLGGPGAAARAAVEVEEAIRLRKALVIAAQKSVGDSE